MVSRDTVSRELRILTLLSLGNQELVAAATAHVPFIILGPRPHIWHGLCPAQVARAQLGRYLPPASLLSQSQASQGQLRPLSMVVSAQKVLDGPGAGYTQTSCPRGSSHGLSSMEDPEVQG